MAQGLYLAHQGILSRLQQDPQPCPAQVPCLGHDKCPQSHCSLVHSGAGAARWPDSISQQLQWQQLLMAVAASLHHCCQTWPCCQDTLVHPVPTTRGPGCSEQAGSPRRPAQDPCRQGVLGQTNEIGH